MADEKEWTIMVYMAGDNNLNLEMVYALEKIKAVVNDNKNINLYVYFDGASSDVPTLYCDFSDPVSPFHQSYKIKNKLIDVHKRSNENLSSNENSAAVNNLINFVDWCVKKDVYAADDGTIVDDRKDKKYAFIFSGHSFGFLNWGLFKDDKSNYTMTHAKLKYAFERITSPKKVLLEKAEGKDWSDEYLKEKTSEILGKRLDLLGFDSCVMSTLEIGSQFQAIAKTMVASEGSIPNAGWNYTEILLGKINKNPLSEAKEIAASFVYEFIKKQNKFALADISVDIAAWDLEVLSKLEDSFGELVSNLLECFKDKNSFVYNPMRRLLVYAHWRCQTYLFEQHVDLGDFCGQLVEEIGYLKNEITEKDITPILDVEKSCVRVIESIRECVLINGFSGSDFQFSKGISLFFPWSLISYNCARKDYEKLSFIYKNDAGRIWNEFLQKFLSEVTMRESAPLTPTDKDGNILPSKDLVSVVYQSYKYLVDASDNQDSDVSEIQDKTKQPPDGTKQPPDGTKQPPDGSKQPPDGSKQPPDGSKLFGALNVFLSSFKILKNFESNWNHSGFTSNKILFKSKPAVDNQAAFKPSGDEFEILIPGVIGIQKMGDVPPRLEALGQIHPNVDIQKYLVLLEKLKDNSDEQTNFEVVKELSRSKLFNSIEIKEEELESDLKNAFSKSIASISDIKIKEEMLKNLAVTQLK